MMATTPNHPSSSSRLQELTPHAEIVSGRQARAVNVAAAMGLQSVLKSNLGPRGTLKMLVGGAGQLKLTKDGQVLLREMQIQHPTARMIARTATAQDDVTGDGTTSTVLLCGELMRQAERYASEGLHPRVLVEGLERARDAVLEFLNDSFLVRFDGRDDDDDDNNNKNSNSENLPMIRNRDLLESVASTSLLTKLDAETGKVLTRAIVDAIQCIADRSHEEDDDDDEEEDNNDDNDNDKDVEKKDKSEEVTAKGDEGDQTQQKQPTSSSDRRKKRQTQSRQRPLDLNRVEIMVMEGHMATDSRFVNGIVLDHGSRHPDMPTKLENCYVMTCNTTLEYEKTEVQSGFFYSTAEEREKLVESERKWLDDRCRAVVDFKRSVCTNGESFVMINQKGIDPLSLDIFAKEGILCLRRAKRRNMERLTLACGGSPIHSLEDLTADQLGWAGRVSEVTLGEDKFTFVEDCRHARSCTLLLQGPNDFTIQQMKDALRDGLRASKNALEDGALVPGGGAFELAASLHLRNVVSKRPGLGRTKLGVLAFAEALLVIPKTLAENSGLDVQDCILRLEEEREANPTMPVGLNTLSGEPMISSDEGIWDNVRVKRQSLYLATVLANQLLLVDEVMRAGKQMGQLPPSDADPMDLNQ